MGKRKNLAAQRRARERYRKRLFIEKLEEWEQDFKRHPDKMPTLKVWFDGLEHVLRDHRLTNAMHVYRTGEPWPGKPVEQQDGLARSFVQSQNYPVPHISDAQRKERLDRVRGMLQEAPEAIKVLETFEKPIVIDFDALEQGK